LNNQRGAIETESRLSRLEKPDGIKQKVQGRVNDKGETIKKAKPKQTLSMDINVAYVIWGHKGNALLMKTANTQ
jgi:hypothetical protein